MDSPGQRAVGRGQWLTVEDLVSFTVEGVEVLLRMDLAYRRPDGRVLIVDWKTGRGEGRFNEVQLAGYALYAAQAGWAASPEEIRTELAYLAVPRYVQRAVDGRKLDHARSFIAKSAGNMKALLLDPMANLARLEDFAMVDRPQRCRRVAAILPSTSRRAWPRPLPWPLLAHGERCNAQTACYTEQ